MSGTLVGYETTKQDITVTPRKMDVSMWTQVPSDTFVATVRFDSDQGEDQDAARLQRASSLDSTALYPGGSCTPVSVPPTPNARNTHMDAWSKYTERVLQTAVQSLSDQFGSSTMEEAEQNIMRSVSNQNSKASSEGSDVHLDESPPTSASTSFAPTPDLKSPPMSVGGMPSAIPAMPPIDQASREAIARVADSSFKALLAEVESCKDTLSEKWKLISKRKGIITLHRANESKRDRSISWIGRGILNRPAKALFEYLADHRTRYQYTPSSRQWNLSTAWRRMLRCTMRGTKRSTAF